MNDVTDLDEYRARETSPVPTKQIPSLSSLARRLGISLQETENLTSNLGLELLTILEEGRPMMVANREQGGFSPLVLTIGGRDVGIEYWDRQDEESERYREETAEWKRQEKKKTRLVLGGAALFVLISPLLVWLIMWIMR